MALFAAIAALACDDTIEPEASAPRGAPAPDGFYIEDIAVGGKGCADPGSVATVVSPDQTTFRLYFYEMILKLPPGPAVTTTNCQAALKLHIPEGWQFSLATMHARGYAFVEEGVKARQTSSYFLAGVPVGLKFHADIEGPYDDFYWAKNPIPPEAAVWSPCGGSAIFAVNTSLIVNAVANPEGRASFNVLDQRLIAWQWQKC